MTSYLLWPLMKKYRKLILSMIAVSSLGIAMMTGLSSAYDTLDVSLDRYVHDYRYADAVITTKLTEEDHREEILRLPGVKQVNSRIAADVRVRLGEERIVTIRAFSYGVRDFQQFYVWEQEEQAGMVNVALDYQFAKRNDLHAGDTMEALVDGEYQRVAIGRIVSSAECLAVQQNAYSWSDNPDFGYVFVPAELLYGTELSGQSDQLLLRFETWADAGQTLEEVNALLGKEQVVSSFLYRDSMLFKRIEMNLQPMYTLSVFLPVLFFVCMIGVVSLFLSQIVRQCRRDIGILRALGFERKHIRSLFNRITLVITLAASVLGMGIGFWLMYFTGRLYGDFFPIPKLYFCWNWWMCLLAVGITVAAGQVSSWISTTSLAKIQPTEAMSREAPGTVSGSTGLQRFLSAASPAVKYSLTSLLRNPKRFAFSALCIGASVTLILGAVAFNESKNSILTALYDGRIHYDCQIFLTEAPGQDLMDKINHYCPGDSCEVLDYYYREISFGGRTESILLNAAEPGTKKITVPGTGSQSLEIPQSGLILEKHTADALEVRSGDTVEIDGIPMTVAALSDQSMNRVSYLSSQQADSLSEPDQFCLICNHPDETALLAMLSEEDSFSSANFTHLLREGSEETFATYRLGVEVLIVFAVLLGMIVVYNTTQTNLFEQRKQLSVLRALGFQIWDISNIWLIQSMLQFCLSCLLGLPVGTVMARYALAQMATEGREYPMSDDPMQYLITVALVLAYVLASHFLAMRSIRKWDISENTKEKE